MEVERRIVKQYKCHFCRACENYKGKVMEDAKISVLASFFRLTRRLQIQSWGKCARFFFFWGASYSTSNVLVCCQTHSDYGPSKMPLELANSLSPPSIVKTEGTHRK